MTEKSKKLIRSWLSWITFLVIVVFAPRPHNNLIKTDGDALAALFFVLLLLSAGGSARLAAIRFTVSGKACDSPTCC